MYNLYHCCTFLHHNINLPCPIISTEFCNLWNSDIIQIIWTKRTPNGCEACSKILVGKSEGKRHLEGRGHEREANPKIDLKGIRCEGWDWINLAQDRDKWQIDLGKVLHHPGSIKWREFLVHLSLQTILLVGTCYFIRSWLHIGNAQYPSPICILVTSASRTHADILSIGQHV